ncbi:hypothetical protein IT41_00455 [Paracoccus halophilus]|nr:hypothetical protein IT41_00455 [Paracoccus halophilus]
MKQLPALRRITEGRARSSQLTTVYFDTPERDLQQQGLSLCVTRQGRGYLQSVTQTGMLPGTLPDWMEWEGPVPGQDIDLAAIDSKKLHRLLQDIGAERLQPVFQTDIQRSSRMLTFDGGGTARLELDRGQLLAGEASAPVVEFRLTLESGAPEPLFDLAQEIYQTVPFRLASMSMAARGYALLGPDEARFRKNGGLDLAADDTVEQALVQIIGHCRDHLRANEVSVLTTDEVEGVHQMRVALRRLRAAMRIFRPSIAAEHYAWITDEAKWLTGELTEAREWDVFSEEFLTPVAQRYDADQGFTELAEAVEQARRRGRQRARDAVADGRYTGFLLRLDAWLSSPARRAGATDEPPAHLDEPIGQHCAALLKKRDRQVRKRGRDIASLSDTELHELRLAVKKLRYAVGFFEGLFPPKQVKPYQTHLAGLQDALGHQNDVAVADTLLRGLAGETGGAPPPVWAYAAGQITGWYRHAAIAARQSLVGDMGAFLQTKPFWKGA